MTAAADARREIREVLEAYLHGLDSRNPDLVAACFAPDARVQYHGAVGGATSREAIIDLLAAAGAFSGENWAASLHVLGNASIFLSCMTEAESASHVEAVLIDCPRGSGDVLRRGLRYTDRLVRAGPEWVIRERRHELIWSYKAQGAARSSATHSPRKGTEGHG